MIDGAMIAPAAAHLTMVGEPETALAVEDDVVRPLQPLALETVEERRHRPAGEVDPLDRAAGGVVRGMTGKEQRPRPGPLEPAIVADIGSTIGADRHPIGPAAQFGHDRQASVRGDAGQRAARNLYKQHRPVGHRHRPFGKVQAGGDDLGRAEVAHSGFDRGALRKSAASKPSGAATSTIGSSRASNSMRSARVMTACMS